MPYNSIPIKIYMVFMILFVVLYLFFSHFHNRIPFLKKHETAIIIIGSAAVLILCAIGQLTFGSS